ncbi:MAG: small multi-drug export protein [Planctomycetota bacterium]
MTRATPQESASSAKFKRMRKLAEIRRKLREDSPRSAIPTWLWVLLTVTPFALYVVFLFVAAETLGPRTTGHVVMWSGWSFVVGRWVIFLAAMAKSFAVNVWLMVVITFYMEVATAVFLIPNIDLLYRVPMLGPWLDQIQLASWEVLQANAWLRRLTWFGLVIFVALPVMGTGATGGTFFGRLLGLTRFMTVLGVTVGGAIGCVALGFATAFLQRRAQDLFQHPAIYISTLVLLVIFLIVFTRRLRGAE